MQAAVLQPSKYPIQKEIRFPKVIAFLKSKERKSWKTAKTYRDMILRFQRFLDERYPVYNVETVLEPLGKGEIDVYRLLDDVVGFYSERVKSVRLTIEGIKSYLQYYDIDIIPNKFKNKVTLPGDRKEDERPLDYQDVRRILLATTKPKLRAYLFMLASGGMRAVEGLAIRLKDVDFSVSPVKIYMRAEFSKNKLPREIYISDEAIEQLKRWIDSKYKDRKSNPEDLIFAITTEDPDSVYADLQPDFIDVLTTLGLDQRKEGQIRHEITLHSFRRFVETVIEDNTSANFADYILGHKKSVYYNHKEPERRRIYNEKCHKALTFLDYETLDRREKGIEAEVEKQSKDNDALWKTIENMKLMIQDLRAQLKDKNS